MNKKHLFTLALGMATTIVANIPHEEITPTSPLIEAAQVTTEEVAAPSQLVEVAQTEAVEAAVVAVIVATKEFEAEHTTDLKELVVAEEVKAEHTTDLKELVVAEEVKAEEVVTADLAVIITISLANAIALTGDFSLTEDSCFVHEGTHYMITTVTATSVNPLVEASQN